MILRSRSRTSSWGQAVITMLSLTLVIWAPTRAASAVTHLVVPIRPSSEWHTRYKLIVLGTFGGPNSRVSIDTSPDTVLSEEGAVAGCADTSAPDVDYLNFNPNFPGGQDRFIEHAFQWKDGIMTDLGALPGANSSCVSYTSGNGLVVGGSENAVIDPLTEYPEAQAVLWGDGQMINLGTLGGNESVPIGVNDRGQVVGAAANSIPDPLSFFGFGTQTRAFQWQHGVMRDLGTLGGPDAFGIAINDRGQVLGFSYVNSIPNPTTGIPTGDGFFEDHGTMTAIPDVPGGTIVSPFFLNNRGQVVGSADLPGDLPEQLHPFIWERGVFTDLGTFGGTRGHAVWVNEAGQVVGDANVCDKCYKDGAVFHAFIWEHGVKSDLGTVGTDGCSVAYSINSRGQVVGYSEPCDFSTVRAFLWQKGGPMVDLNALIPANSDLQLLVATNINDRGEIAGLGATRDGHERAFLLIPDGTTDMIRDVTALRARLAPSEAAAIQARLAHRYVGYRRRAQK